MMTQKTKIVAFLILSIFLLDSTAIWDMLGHRGFVPEDIIKVEYNETLPQLHANSDTQNHSNSNDTCTLCPCCVTHLSMLATAFIYTNAILPTGKYEPLTEQVHYFSEHKFFRPPKSLS